jgi:A/G-specific adenine glycosylase
MSKTLIHSFSKKLIAWHAHSGRSGLPWQGNRDPYAVWVSEIMLQQTQVATVLERYPRFMKRFPTVKKLAASDIDDVLAEWAGLGYYSRARNLHACAQQIVCGFGGKFPSEPDQLEQLKGIGRSTAGAIAAFAFHERAPILDANVKRILARLFAVEGAIQDKSVNDYLWELATELLPLKPQDMPIYTQALPKKVIKSKSPEFDCHMLLLRSGNSVLLQKRPDKAIWGGLWSLPESPWAQRDLDSSKNELSPNELFALTLPEEKLTAFLKTCASPIRGMHIKHVFTHRRLWMQVWEMSAPEPIPFTTPNKKWVSLTQIGCYGLPQPIKVLLQGLSLVRDVDLKN